MIATILRATRKTRCASRRCARDSNRGGRKMGTAGLRWRRSRGGLLILTHERATHHPARWRHRRLVFCPDDCARAVVRAKKIRSAEALSLADREATWPVIGASMFSANISRQQFVGQAGLAYTIGIAAGGFQLVGALCFALLAAFFVDVYLPLKLRTAPEFFERRYRPGARMFVAALNLMLIVAASIARALYAGA